MASTRNTHPFSYLSTHAFYLLEVVQAIYKEKPSFESVHLAVSQRASERADYAWLHFYYKQQSSDKLDNPDYTKDGNVVLQVHDIIHRIENKWFIEELQERVGIHYPYPGIQYRENNNHVRYQTFSDAFTYEELVVALKEMAQEQFTGKLDILSQHQSRQDIILLIFIA